MLDVLGDVLGAGSTGRQTTLQGLQDQARGIIKLLRISHGLRTRKQIYSYNDTSHTKLEAMKDFKSSQNLMILISRSCEYL